MKTDHQDFLENESKWDLQELPLGHEQRFLLKLNSKKPKSRKNLYRIMGVAAIFIVGFLLFQNVNSNQSVQKPRNLLSDQTLETTQYFEYLVASELEKLKVHQDSLSQKVINEALIELDQLEADYQKIELELKNNGETKQLIHAMIVNFQTRISFLENVLNQIESIKNQKNNQKNNQNENNLL